MNDNVSTWEIRKNPANWAVIVQAIELGPNHINGIAYPINGMLNRLQVMELLYMHWFALKEPCTEINGYKGQLVFLKSIRGNMAVDSLDVISALPYTSIHPADKTAIAPIKDACAEIGNTYFKWKCSNNRCSYQKKRKTYRHFGPSILIGATRICPFCPNSWVTKTECTKDGQWLDEKPESPQERYFRSNDTSCVVVMTSEDGPYEIITCSKPNKRRKGFCSSFAAWERHIGSGVVEIPSDEVNEYLGLLKGTLNGK